MDGGNNQHWLIDIDELTNIRKVPLELLVGQMIALVNRVSIDDNDKQYINAVLQMWRLTVAYHNKPTMDIKEHLDAEMEERLSRIRPDKYGRLDTAVVMQVRRHHAEKLFEVMMIALKSKGLTPETEVVDTI